MCVCVYSNMFANVYLEFALQRHRNKHTGSTRYVTPSVSTTTTFLPVFLIHIQASWSWCHTLPWQTKFPPLCPLLLVSGRRLKNGPFLCNTTFRFALNHNGLPLLQTQVFQPSLACGLPRLLSFTLNFRDQILRGWSQWGQSVGPSSHWAFCKAASSLQDQVEVPW